MSNVSFCALSDESPATLLPASQPTVSLRTLLPSIPFFRLTVVSLRQGVKEVMTGRLDLAVEKGCDGVEPDQMEVRWFLHHPPPVFPTPRGGRLALCEQSFSYASLLESVSRGQAV